MKSLNHYYSKIGLKLKTNRLQWAGRMGLSDRLYENARGVRILVYHGICKSDHTRFNPIFQKLHIFEKHLQFYKKYFNLVSLNEVYRNNYDPDRFNICLSFDDGYANNYKYVLPLLEKYKVPAVFFVTAIRDAGYDILWNDFLGIITKYSPSQIDFLGEHYRKDEWQRYISENTGETLASELRKSGFEKKVLMMEQLYSLAPFRQRKEEEDYWLQMTTEQIKEMSASSFVTIGCHGYYHNDLAAIDLADAKLEMARSKTYLENIIQKPVNTIAFPYGNYSIPLLVEARTAGFDELLGDRFLSPDDAKEVYLKERFTVNPFISLHHQMHANITAKY